MRKTGLVAATLLFGLIPIATTASEATCGPLPAPTGAVVAVDTVGELQAAVANLTSGTTVSIADGVYDLTNTLNIRNVNDVTLRSASGRREGVVLRGRGMSNLNFGNVPHVIAIYDADNVTIADLTITDAYYHDIQVHGEDDPDGLLLHNLWAKDAGEQIIKGSTAGPPGPYADNGTVECSLIEYTDRARSYYTNGVDVLGGSGWIIRDNTFRNIRAPAGQLAGPAILMWRNSIDTVVERNLFIECDRAIALGLSAPDGNSRDGETVYDHQGGLIRNNMIYRAGDGDVGITVNYARSVVIEHNTVVQNGTFPQGTIEYRFGSTSAVIRYNLTDGPIWQRDGANGTLASNLTTAAPTWFQAPAAGDLHLTAAAGGAIDQAAGSALGNDYDLQPRPSGAAADLGADEFGGSLPPSGFWDVPAGHPFEADIVWLAENGITLGCGNDRFCPDLAVTRGQMASFLVRALGLPASAVDAFTDDNGSIHEADIQALAAAGITVGCGGSRFCPDLAVTRAQMASFLVRALSLPASVVDAFTDDNGSIHEADIQALAAAGITFGCGGSRFCPTTAVARGQMAAFLYRALG
ncbi:MAG TPA: S-layer homology domain-containing protein [Acidimicrobiia bacterium]